MMLILDQSVKRFFQAFNAFKINNYLSLQTSWNKGVGFSLLSDTSNGFLIFLTSLLSLYICYLFFNSNKEGEKVALALILAGAVGNLLDRIMFAGVLDFIVIKNSYYQFPAFNIADMSITCGGVMLAYYGLFGDKKTGDKFVKNTAKK